MTLFYFPSKNKSPLCYVKMRLKRQTFSRTYLGYSIIRDQYMIKPLNLDLFCDEGPLVFEKSNV